MKPQLFFPVIAAVFVLLVSTNTAGAVPQACTPVSGLIAEDAVWSAASSPYCVTSNVVVAEGVTLTVQPGTTVRFSKGTGLVVQGELLARGSPENYITFTSDQSPPARGDWAQIRFEDSSVDASFDDADSYTGGSIIQYSVVEYGG